MTRNAWGGGIYAAFTFPVVRHPRFVKCTFLSLFLILIGVTEAPVVVLLSGIQVDNISWTVIRRHPPPLPPSFTFCVVLYATRDGHCFDNFIRE